MDDEAEAWRFLRDRGGNNLADDPRLSLMAACVANQQRFANFRNAIDIREFKCHVCGSAGFNSGMGVIVHTCGAEWLPDGEAAAACPHEGDESWPIHAWSWRRRIDNYVRQTKFPRSLFIAEDGRVVGTWIMGNSYKVRSGFYGGYPDGYLRRIKALFPEKKKILHLFSGKVDQSILPGDTVDIDPSLSPTYVDDAQRLDGVPLDQYDLVLADPPYSIEDAERYQVSMVKRNSVMSALRRLNSGTHVVWLDQVLPMCRKDTFAIDAVVGLVKSTNHRFRVVTIFRRL
jgi:hypothetical protein